VSNKVSSLDFEGLSIEVYRHTRTGVLTVDICTLDAEDADYWQKNAVPKLRVLINDCIIAVDEDGCVRDNVEIYPELSALEQLALEAE
jgi:hypothetical protein